MINIEGLICMMGDINRSNSLKMSDDMKTAEVRDCTSRDSRALIYSSILCLCQLKTKPPYIPTTARELREANPSSFRIISSLSPCIGRLNIQGLRVHHANNAGRSTYLQDSVRGDAGESPFM